MKVVNHTVYETKHLRAILAKAAAIELEPAKRKVLIVTVEYTRGGLSSGCAYVGGRHATVRIRHPESRSWKASRAPFETERVRIVEHFASVASHEFAHIRGMEHATMSAKYKWSGNWQDYVSWATAMPLGVKKARPPVKLTPLAKLEHVLAMKARAETRVKRATTILKKWKARERYYTKAAQKGEAS